MKNDQSFQYWRYSVTHGIGYLYRLLGLLTAFGLPCFAQHGGGGGAAALLALAVIVFALFAAYRIVRWFWSLLRKRPPISPVPTTFRVKPGSLFISYRRRDTEDVTGRLTDRLAERLGANAFFKDVKNIEIGRNFRKDIAEAMDRCEVLLVIIGRFWAGEDSDASGHTRLSEARDSVRTEIEVAFAKGIPIIPVLVMGASMPNESVLPESLQELADINAISIRPDPDFSNDVELLIRGIGLILSERRRRPAKRRPRRLGDI